MAGGRGFVALLLGALTVLTLLSTWLYTSGSLQHIEAAHIVSSDVVEKADSRQLYSAAAAAAGEDSGELDGPESTSASLEPAASGGVCGHVLRPYHVLITSSSGVYQAWQTRIMYYHVVKQKQAEGACSEIGGITRLLTMPGGKADDLMEVIPT